MRPQVMETWVVAGDSALLEDPEAKYRLNSTAHWICVGPFTSHRQAKEENDKLHTLRARLDSARDAAMAYRELTVCFKLNKAPSEKLFKRLDKANKWLAEAGEE